MAIMQFSIFFQLVLLFVIINKRIVNHLIAKKLFKKFVKK